MQVQFEKPMLNDPEPRWPAILAILSVGGLYAALPASLAATAPHTFFGIVCFLLAFSVLTHGTGYHELNQIVGYILIGVVTIAMVVSVLLLVTALPTHKEPPVVLLRSAASLWITNVIVFALWYWRLDAGGPHQRDLRIEHTHGAFLFPQMTMSQEQQVTMHCDNWSPTFIDYLFLAFNTSTALSPTDVPVLSRWAKALMMLQSLISLTVVVVLAGRAVNIL